MDIGHLQGCLAWLNTWLLVTFLCSVTLKGEGHRAKLMTPSDSLTLKHRSRHQNRHPKCCSS